MKISVIPGRELSDDLVRVWVQLQQANPALTSPFFHPEFTRIVAMVRDDVEVAIIQNGGDIVGFFPFHRRPGSVGMPVGEIISDYHGVISAPEFNCDPKALIRQCRLVAWDFNHLIATQPMFIPFHRHLEPSPLIDLSAGFETYAKVCHAARQEFIKLRRLERDLGPVRLVAATTDERLLNRVFAWKSAQWLRTSDRDKFSIPWIRAVINRIHRAQSLDFAGVLSVLYAGNIPVAGHFGMRAGNVWHWWFPSYASEYARYSPGLVLLIKMAESASSLGLRTIDLGKGKTLYKDRFKNSEVMLAEGSVELPSLVTLRRQLRRSVRSLVGKTPLELPAQRLVQLVRRLRGVQRP
jgi:CelD/BcsL family acetyltransferase involved in cellulose biosynthesis